VSDDGTDIIPPFSYMFPDVRIIPRGGSAYICTEGEGSDREDVLAGITISKPISQSAKNYIGMFLGHHTVCDF